MKTLIRSIALLVAALSASVAHASTSESVSSSAGESKGNWWVSINMPFNSYAAYNHDGSTNYVFTQMSARPNATLLGYNYTFLDVSAAAEPVRQSPATGSTTYAQGFFQLAGTNFMNCSGWVRGTTVSCETVKSTSVKLFSNSTTYWVAGFIPLTLTENLTASFNASVVGKGTMSTLSNTTTTQDTAFARMSASGTLTGVVEALFGIGDPIPAGVGGGVKVTLFNISLSGPTGSAQRTRNGSTTAYRLDTKAAGTSYNGLGGSVYFKACLGSCYTDNLYSWSSLHWGDFSWDPKVLTRSLAATI